MITSGFVLHYLSGCEHHNTKLTKLGEKQQITQFYFVRFIINYKQQKTRDFIFSNKALTF